MKRLSLLAALSLSARAFAAAPSDLPSTPNQPGQGQEQATSIANDGPFHVNTLFNFTTAYMFRGVDVTDHGLIFQPDVNLSYVVYDKDGVTITPHLDLWSNITDQHYDGSIDYWDELDIAPSVDIAFGKWTFTPQYLCYYSPANNFRTTHELGLTVAYDDTGLWGDAHKDFALSPYVSVFQTLDDPNTHNHGTYYELGIEPSFTVNGFNPLSVSTPIKFGGGFGKYYESDSGHNDYAGYAEIGIAAKYQFNDHLYVKAEVDYYRGFSDDVRESFGDNDDNKVVGTIGLGYDF